MRKQPAYKLCHHGSFSILSVHNSVVEQLNKPKPVDIDIIFEAVSIALGIPKYQLKGDCRKRRITEARFILVKMIDVHCAMGSSKTGRLLNKDHSTIIYARKIYKDLIEVDVMFRTKVTLVQKKIKELSHEV